MTRTVLFGVGLWLAGGAMAFAQAPAPDNSLPDGTFASTRDDCAKLAERTPAEIGDEIDFELVTRKGLIGYRQVCDFVNVSARDAKSWVATAFCDESGYTYPDLFSIRQKDDGRLNVTRMTDLTQQGGYDASAQADPGESDTAEQQAGAPAEPPSETAEEHDASESYSSFVKCESVKP
jgi:hypothetical protein